MKRLRAFVHHPHWSVNPCIGGKCGWRGQLAHRATNRYIAKPNIRGTTLLLRTAFAAAALASSTAASAAWHVAESQHFVVYADDAADDTKEYAEELELFDAAVRLTTGIPDDPISPSNRVTVFLVDDVADLRRLYTGGKGNGGLVYGFYQGRASGSYAFAFRNSVNRGKFDLDPKSVLQHEYAHHLMLGTYSGVIPAWPVEGWAEFFATIKTDRKDNVIVGAPPLYRAYGLMEGKPLRLTAMVSGEYDDLRGDQLEALYGRGWALTHYLLFQDLLKRPRAGQLTAYLRALNEGQTGRQAATGAFGDLSVLDKELDRELRARMISSLNFKPEMLPTGPVTVRPLRGGEAAILPVRMRSKRGVDEDSAPKVLADARKIAAIHPDDPFVQLTLAEAEHDAGNLEAALAAGIRAVALDPKETEGLIYQGRARLRMLMKSGGDAAAWSAARAPIMAANRMENDDAEPLMLYYQSFLMASERPSENAVAALMQSQRLAPQDAGLRLMATRQLLIDSDGPAARRMAAPIAFNPHGGGLSLLTRELVKRLDDGGPRTALAFMDQSQGEIDAAEEE